MFCRNCGNEMKENESFCAKCGTKAEIQAEEPVAEAPVPETNVNEQPVADTCTQAPNSIYSEPLVNDSGNGPKKKWFLKVVLPVAIILALAVTSFAHPVTRNMVMRTFMSNESYFNHVVKNGAEDLAENFVASFSEYRNLLNGKFDGVSGSCEIEIGDAVKDYVYDAAEYEVYEAVEWIDTIGFDFDGGKTDDVYGANYTYSINGSDLISANLAMDDEGIYLSLPEINDKAIFYDFKSALGDAGLEFGEFEQIFSCMDEIMEIIPDDKVLEDIIVRYITAVAKGVENVDEEKIKIEAGGIKQSAVSMTIDVDDDLLVSVMESVLNEVLEDKDIEKLINDVCDLSMVDLDGDDTYDEFIDGVENILDELDDIPEIDEEIEISVIADNRGQIIGLAANVEGAEAELYLVEDGKNYGQLLSVDPGQGMSFKLEGKGKLNGGKYNGEIAVNVNGMDIVEISIENVDKGLWKDGIFSGKISVSPSDGIGKLLSSSGNDMVSLISDLSIEIESNSTEKDGNVILAAYKGEDLIASINTTYAASSDTKYTVPDDYVVADDESDLEEWATESQNNCLKLLEKLTNLGFPSHLLEDIY